MKLRYRELQSVPGSVCLQHRVIKTMEEEVEADAKMGEDDFDLGFAKDLEEYHEVDDDLEITGEEVMADCRPYTPRQHHPHRRHYPGHRFFIMYHGTTWNNAMKIKAHGFKRSSDGMLGPGVYLSRDFRKASQYPLTGRSQKLAVIKVRVRVGKVKRIDRQGHPLQKTWHQNGYDTAWVPPNCGMVPSGLEEDCVYDPSRIQVLEIIPN